MSNNKYFLTAGEFYKELVDIFLDTITNTKKNIMISGGKTPIPLYKKIRNLSLNWEGVSLIISDERDVKMNHKLSNEGSIRKLLGFNNNSKTIIGLRDKRSQKIIKGIREYDLSILGMGIDGHFASIFPNSRNLEESLNTHKSIVYINDGYPDVPRYTLSLNEILKSKKIILLVSNTEKYKLINTKRSKKELLPIDYLIQKAMHKLNLVVLENK